MSTKLGDRVVAAGEFEAIIERWWLPRIAAEDNVARLLRDV